MNKRVGVFGATSVVGYALMKQLLDAEWDITAFSRQDDNQPMNGVTWCKISGDKHPTHLKSSNVENIPYWIIVSPIWILPNWLDCIHSYGAERIIVLSSTSRYTKEHSANLHERSIAHQITSSEHALQLWADKYHAEWIILRPTLIYGYGRDKNISEIARFINRFRFFPLLGNASGLRQPIHADDVAKACLVALDGRQVLNRSYNLAGGETLSYREMVKRVFTALGYSPRLITIPLFMFRAAVACLRVLPRYRNWTPAMAQRMNSDLVFDYSDAARDIDFSPRGFKLIKGDLPGQ